MCAECEARRAGIEPKMRPIRAFSEIDVMVDFGFLGGWLTVPEAAEEYVVGEEPDPTVIRGCGELFAGGWVAIEAVPDPVPQAEMWRVTRFVRVATRGEAIDNLDLWATLDLVAQMHPEGAQ